MRVPYKYVARRVVYLIAVVWVAATLNFVLPRLAGRDPVMERLIEMSGSGGRRGEWITELAESYREWAGLNEPLWQQYVTYLRNMLHMDFGRSMMDRRPVLDIVGYALPWTLGLLGTTTILAFVIGTVLGAFSAWPGASRLVNAFVPVLMILSVIPPFIIALILIDLLAFRAKLFPLAGVYTPSRYIELASLDFWLDVLRHAALPAISILLASIGTWAMGMRGMLITVLGQDFITFADAKGLRRPRLFLGYAVRNVMLPQTTALAMSLGTLVANATMVEIVFGYPGLGSVLERAIRNFDYNLIQGCVFFLILGIAIATFILDLIYPWLDPRIRYEKV